MLKNHRFIQRCHFLVNLHTTSAGLLTLIQCLIRGRVRLIIKAHKHYTHIIMESHSILAFRNGKLPWTPPVLNSFSVGQENHIWMSKWYLQSGLLPLTPQRRSFQENAGEEAKTPERPNQIKHFWARIYLKRARAEELFSFSRCNSNDSRFSLYMGGTFLGAVFSAGGSWEGQCS